MISAAHQQAPYLAEGVVVTHSVIPGTIVLPLADDGMQGTATSVQVRVAKDRYVRTIQVNLSRAGKAPDMPPEAKPNVGEILLSSTLQMADPMLDPSENPVYQLSGTVIYTTTTPPPTAFSYPASPLQAAATPSLVGAITAG